MVIFRYETSRPGMGGHGGFHYLKCPKCQNTYFYSGFWGGVKCSKCGYKMPKDKIYGRIKHEH